jgi:hypothetical protein
VEVSKGARYRTTKQAERARTEACRCAAVVLAGRPDDTIAPLCWSLATFFESYIAHGSKWTQKDFGPKKAVKLKLVGK